MKNTVRIQDDLFEFVNGEVLAKKEIPNDLPAAGGFFDLSIDVENKLINDFDALMVDNSSIKNDSIMLNVIQIYKKILENNINGSDGIMLLSNKLKMIDKIENIDFFNTHLLDLYNYNIPLPFKFGVDVNMKSTDKYCIYFHGPTTILPDVSYYSNKEKKDALFTVWKKMVKEILVFNKELNENKIDKLIENAIIFDEMISKIVKSSLEWSKYTENYNPYTFDEFKTKTKVVKFDSLFVKLFGNQISQVIVYDTKFINNFENLFNDSTIEFYKSWAYVNYICNNCSYLGEQLRQIGDSFSRFLRGTSSSYPIKRFALTLLTRLLPEPIGIYFGKKYLGDKAKNDVIKMVEGLIQSYKERLSINTWLSSETKAKAILKLDCMTLKIGYPNKLSPVYNSLKLSMSKSLYEIAFDINIQKENYNNSLLFKPVDKDKWFMPGHYVNACYNPTSNDITFPAAILQPPFYSINQHPAANLGGIGTIIGHEISHAFDNNGAQCDEKGNLKNWWTKNDFETFEVKTKDMIKQFDKLPLGTGFVNGELVVSENIADLGGMASALQTMERQKCIDYKEFFENYGRIWSQKSRPEYQQLLLAIDNHSPAYWRANMIPRNFMQWYSTYNVTDKDKMYLPCDKRLVIW